MRKPLTVKQQWERKTPPQRDAWIAEVLFGWSVTKTPVYWDGYGGNYEGNPLGKRNKLGGLAGVHVERIPRHTNLAKAKHWIPLLEEALGDDGGQV